MATKVATSNLGLKLKKTVAPEAHKHLDAERDVVTASCPQGQHQKPRHPA